MSADANAAIYCAALILAGISTVLLVLGAAWALTRWPMEDRDR